MKKRVNVAVFSCLFPCEYGQFSHGEVCVFIGLVGAVPSHGGFDGEFDIAGLCFGEGDHHLASVHADTSVGAEGIVFAVGAYRNLIFVGESGKHFRCVDALGLKIAHDDMGRTMSAASS